MSKPIHYFIFFLILAVLHQRLYNNCLQFFNI